MRHVRPRLEPRREQALVRLKVIELVKGRRRRLRRIRGLRGVGIVVFVFTADIHRSFLPSFFTSRLDADEQQTSDRCTARKGLFNLQRVDRFFRSWTNAIIDARVARDARRSVSLKRSYVPGLAQS
jgi:hypothetical protein